MIRYNSIYRSLLSLALVAICVSACMAVPENHGARPDQATSPQAAASQANLASEVSEINRGIASLAGQSAPASADYRIGPEDMLQITLYNIPEGDGKITVTPRVTTTRVSHDGLITLPLLGEVPVKGSTVLQFERALRERYDKYLHNPQVGVLVTEFRQKVSVIGAVQKPGVFELTGPKTVVDMLAMAGGVNEKASSQVHIYRNEGENRQNHVIDLLVLAGTTSGFANADPALINMPVKAGDVINVPGAGTFFVDGAVNKPGSYQLGRNYTLTQALAVAGGVDSELASYSDITIFRRKAPGQVEALAFDLSGVRSGTAADPEVRGDDVILVPTSAAKYFVRRFVGTLLGGGHVLSLVRMGMAGS